MKRVLEILAFYLILFAIINSKLMAVSTSTENNSIKSTTDTTERQNIPTPKLTFETNINDQKNLKNFFTPITSTLLFNQLHTSEKLKLTLISNAQNSNKKEFTNQLTDNFKSNTASNASLITPNSINVSKIFKGSLVFPVLPSPKLDSPKEIIQLEIHNGTEPQIIRKISQRPLAIMVENHAHARPQTALDEAQVVYEIPVEGGITRFMALYYHTPEVVGPVRSCREYFIDRAFEVNPLYVHCGGSPKGYEYIGKTNIFALDEIRFGFPFFRDKTRKAPHNLYVRGKDLVEFASKMHPMQLPYKLLPLLLSSNPTLGTEPAVGLHIRYHGNYFVTYKYNPKYKCYDRYMNSIQHIDRVTQKPVSPKTVILQEALMKIIDDKGRQDISFYGEGNAYIFYQGTLIRAKWKKTALRDFTRYYTLDGKQIEFSNQGPVWIQVVSPNQPWITVPNIHNIHNKEQKLALIAK